MCCFPPRKVCSDPQCPCHTQPCPMPNIDLRCKPKEVQPWQETHGEVLSKMTSIPKPDWETEFDRRRLGHDEEESNLSLKDFVHSLLTSHETSTRKAERESILEMVEGLRRKYDEKVEVANWINFQVQGFNSALDSITDILKNKKK